MTIDRIDPYGHYTKENCRWNTPSGQSRNRRHQAWLTFNSETLTIAEWSERLNISQHMLRTRKLRGWTDQEILTRPRRSNYPY